MQQFTEEQQKQLQEKLKNMSPEQLKELQKQQCIFCQIITGKLPTHKVYEDAQCLAILDINPAAKGHLLLFPKNHYAIMSQVPEEIQGHLLVTAKKLSMTLLKTFKVDGTNIFVANGPAAGQRTQHFLIHVIPRKGGDGIMHFEEKLVNQETALKVVNAVEEKLQELLGLKKTIAGSEKDSGGSRKEIKEINGDEGNADQENANIENETGGNKEIKLNEKRSKPKKRETKVKQKPVPAKKTVKKEGGVSLDDIAKLFK